MTQIVKNLYEFDRMIRNSNFRLFLLECVAKNAIYIVVYCSMYDYYTFYSNKYSADMD